MQTIANPGNSPEIKSGRRTYQTGHAKNVSNLESLIPFIEGYGAIYNPSKALLKVEALKTLRDQATLYLNGVNVALSNYTYAVTEREMAFDGIDVLVTNIFLLLKAYEPSKKVLDDMMSYIRKFKGRRAIPKISNSELEQLSGTENEVKYNSVAQLGFDSRVENLDRIITLLETILSYSPNEAEYTLQGLKQKLEELRTKNNKVRDAIVLLSNARIERNKTLYAPVTGLYDVATAVKAYVRALFGLSSLQYKQIKKIDFTPYKS